MKKEQVYILNLEGSTLVGKTDWKDGVPVKTKEKEVYGYDTYYIDKNNKRISKDYKLATLTNSMDLDELKRLESNLITKRNNKPFTNAIINVTFRSTVKDYKYHPRLEVWKRDGKSIIKQNEIRDKLYERGFIVDGIKYLNYKRSSSKSRSGHDLFIREDLYNDMIFYSRIGLEFEVNEMCDMAAIRAYESLSSSSIESYIEIKKENILMIEDKYSKFKVNAMVTKQDEQGNVYTVEEEVDVENCLFDGQCLLSNTLFKEEYKNQGMLLLRNRFFKSCGFNTNISKFFNNHDVKIVKDMFGVEHKAKDIKLICTPTSLKFLKFDYKFNSQKECYDYWLDNLLPRFGIVKSEHPSKLEGYNRLSYQMINSLSLTIDDINLLAMREVKYIEKIRDDVEAFKCHIAYDDKSQTRQVMNELLSINSSILRTRLFRDFKADTLSAYKKLVKMGKVRIAGDYCTMVNNPYLMLMAAIDKYDESKTLLKSNQVYCGAYDDGQELCGFRNPNICTGNVYLAENHYDDKFKRYFNFTDNICVTNAINNDICNRLSGCDWDSDTVLLSDDEILVNKAKQSQKWLTPISDIKAETKKRPYNQKSMSEVDNLIAENYIGQIVNLSQVLNSHYWDIYNTNCDDKRLGDIYKEICTTSVLSSTEIDKAKKLVTVNCEIELNKLQAKYDILKPRFFSTIKNNVKKSKTKYYNCPMDWLGTVINNIGNDERLFKEDEVNVLDLLIECDDKTVNKKQIKLLKTIVAELDGKEKALYSSLDLDDEYREEQQEIVKKEIERKAKKIHLNKCTMLDIIKRLYNPKTKDANISIYRMKMLNTLMMINKDIFLSCFISTNSQESLKKAS